MVEDVKPSRRRVLEGAAWAAPVVVLGTAAPAFAVSPGGIVINTGLPDRITGWRGDHHYGSFESDLSQRDYTFPVTVTDSNGAPLVGATVTVTASGTTPDGDILGVWAYPSPETDGPERSGTPHPTQTLVADANGVARFSIQTQNLGGDGELPATATLTVTVTYEGVTTSKTYTVFITRTD